MKTYGLAITLLLSIVIGSILGLTMGERAQVFKPLGDIFLNLLFTIVVPLVFFSISSAIANLESKGQFKRIIRTMLIVSLITTVVSAVIMIFGVKIYSPTEGITIELEAVETEDIQLGDQIVQTFTVNNFTELFKRENMLPLILFSVALGFATNQLKEKAAPLKKLLQAGADVSMKLVSYIMYYAPIGLAGYFATLVGTFGASLLSSYLRSFLLYLVVSLVYFVVLFTLYSFIAGGPKGIKTFWKHNLLPSATAIGTQSSVATIPANLDATKKMGVSNAVRETVIPIGASIHKDGSAMGAILKIVFAFGVLGIPFEGLNTYLIAIMVAIVTAVVMGGIPGGGLIGEMFIIAAYGLSPEVLPLLAVISTIIDIPATLLNATGDNAVAVLVERFTKKKGEEAAPEFAEA
ncbi:dicarboxylate/amino acid:cation symporter [Cytobacillus spongiae]|uniref:dicarboxylate/amino acid:cation symporter n=1 Tax=Cytobacillus spongiae TaxID=2901381 RepID=UPI001F17E14C|nr:dicarboxylate/amino acid:cation symporter [Cytobacillus spongiae]UII57813.1 dicarboxylate/amino acid:cation symporter [Cytobacillus spongiae]